VTPSAGGDFYSKSQANQQELDKPPSSVGQHREAVDGVGVARVYRVCVGRWRDRAG